MSTLIRNGIIVTADGEQKGRPETVFLRGQKIVEDGKYIGEKGQGRFIPEEPFGAAYK